MTPRIASFCKKRDTLCASFYNDSLQSGCVLVVFRKWKLCFWLFSESERLFLSNKEQQSASLHRSTSSNHKLQENENQFLIKLFLNLNVFWSKNLGTFFRKIAMNRFFESPECFASLLFYIFIIGSLDGCWDGGMSKYETLKNFEDPLIEPRHTIPYHTSHTT